VSELKKIIIDVNNNISKMQSIKHHLKKTGTIQCKLNHVTLSAFAGVGAA